MSENEEHSGVTSPTATMAETEESSQQNEGEQKHSQDREPSIVKKFASMGIKTVRIWPPTQRTRDAVINRLIETLTAPSILSKRYGSLSHDEASTAARAIEEEAFATATAASEAGSRSEVPLDDDGIETLQIYSKEISKRMLETVKAKAAAAAAPPAAVATPPAAAATPGISEENSSVESETS